MTQIPPTVRLATRSDASDLARLRYALRAGAASTAEDRTAFLARCERWMAARLGGAGAWRCWLAERDGGIVGAIWLQVIEKIPNPLGEGERHGYLTSFFVDERARGRGVGSALLAALLDAPETQRLDAIVLWPTERSRSLYTRYGFAATDDVIQRRPAAGLARTASA